MTVGCNCKKNDESVRQAVDITCFADCASSTVVLRMPYEMIVEICRLTYETTEYSSKIVDALCRASSRSNALRKLLINAGFMGEDS